MPLANIPSLSYFIPELILCAAVLVLLIISVYKETHNMSYYVTVLSLFISLLGVIYYIKYHDVFILFEESTEPPGSSDLNFEKRIGTYHSANCHVTLFV